MSNQSRARTRRTITARRCWTCQRGATCVRSTATSRGTLSAKVFDADAAARRRSRGAARFARGARGSATFAGYTEAERFEYTARAALGIAPLWFAAQLAFNYSLLYTSVTSNSILSTSSAIFTFGLSVYLVNERYSKERVLAILVYMLGSALVTLADSAREAGEPSLIPTGQRPSRARVPIPSGEFGSAW